MSVNNEEKPVDESTPILPLTAVNPPVENTLPQGPSKMKIFLKFLAFFAGPVLAFPFMFDILYPGHIKISRCAAVTIMTSIWWIFEPIPIGIGALSPVIFFPLFGVASAGDISSAYFNDNNFLFLSSYIVAIGIEKWNLHRRIALIVLYFTRGIPSLILGGFMFIAFFFSMWLNNTSCAALLLPMAKAVLMDLENTENDPNFSKAIMLAIPYSASIGGISTLTGTGTNLAFSFQIHELFPKHGDFSFLRWMIFATPLAFIFLVICWIYFNILFIRKWRLKTQPTYFKDELMKMGKLSFEEVVMIIFFSLLCLLWIFRELPFGHKIGWGALFIDKYVTDGTASLIICFILFIFPSKNQPGESILNWKDVKKKAPWNILLLLGAGFALARGFERAQFSQFVASTILRIGKLPLVVLLILISILLSIATEFMSNVAIASISLPILGRLAPQLSQNPLFFMIPATIACSFAFMSPIGTPPNALAFGFGYLKFSDMIKSGFILNFIGVFLMIGWIYLTGYPLLGIEIGKVPAWALPNNTTFIYN